MSIERPSAEVDMSIESPCVEGLKTKRSKTSKILKYDGTKVPIHGQSTSKSTTSKSANKMSMPKESTSKEKNRNSNEWVWQKQYNTFPLSESKLTIDGEVLLTFLNTPTPYDIFCKVVGWDDLVLLLKNESERYAQQNGRIFSTTTEEISAFMGVNFLMGINNLPIREYWSTSEGLGNSLI